MTRTQLALTDTVAPSIWLALLLPVLLVACGTTPTPPQHTNRIDHQQQINQLDSWRIRGKVGVRAESGSGSASVDWSQQGKLYEIRLSGALGFGSAHIQGDEQMAHWRQANGERFSSDSPEDVIASALGWSLPIDSLRYWIRGIAAPNAKVTGFEYRGALLYELEQLGWQLSFDRYDHNSTPTLPGRIVMVSAGKQITFLIREWNLEDGL